IAALCVAHAARSDDSIRIRVAYSVARGCPSRARFMEEIRARSARVVEAAAGEEAIDVAVSVSRDASGFAGRVTLGAADAGQTTRSIAGASCA
ncbi:hypothetical protein, partial [Pseudomonas sp. GP01-A4]|uniref:hypothetical protein n=1 Tax=Pseudomonas sp. GP01-A4 TaxID=2070571 RepID=UPI000CC05E9D